MPELIKVRNPKTNKTELQSPLNARDLITHQGWEVVTTASATHDYKDGEGPDAEEIDKIGNRRVKDNSRVAYETGVTNTEKVVSDDAPLGTGGDKNAPVENEHQDDTDDDEDDSHAKDGLTGVVRATSGELVDDKLVAEVKGLNKNQLLAFAKTNYKTDLDGRKNVDDLRLAIFDLDEKANKA